MRTVSDILLSEGTATGRDHFFSASGGGTARAAGGTIDGWESELRTVSDGLLLGGGATGRAHFFSASGGDVARAAGGTIDGRESESRTDISDSSLLEGGATGRAHFFSDSGRGAAHILLGSSAGVSVNVGGELGRWGSDQTLGVGRKGGSGLVHLYSCGVLVFGTLGCKVADNDYC